MNRVIHYGTANQISNVSAQEGEIMAFTVANTYLTECSDRASRTKALHKNQQLWSLLVKDVMHADNLLSPSVKQEIIRLGMWAMAYSVRAMGSNLTLAPLIQVNRNMIEGLRLQMKNNAATRNQPGQSTRMAV